jgi:hypothetical protein
MAPSMGGKAKDDQYSGQETERSRVRVRRCITDRGRRLRLIAASIALLPALAACSSTSSNDYDAAAAAYPSQSLADLLKGSQNSQTPVRTAGPSAPPNSSTAVASGPSPVASSGPATAVAAVPAPSATSDDFDPAASAYPSVSLSDYLSSSTKSSR